MAKKINAAAFSEAKYALRESFDSRVLLFDQKHQPMYIVVDNRDDLAEAVQFTDHHIIMQGGQWISEEIELLRRLRHSIVARGNGLLSCIGFENVVRELDLSSN
jgi:hypothetical protein